MIDESRLAGELGTLLRVEDGIAAELHRAREQFVKQRQTTDFLPGMEPVARQGALDLSGIDDDGFFHEAEARMVEALRRFAESAAGGPGVRRRLFAGDAAQGVALIDLLRTRFDVVLMNPPFGAASLAAKKEFEKSCPRTKNDIFAAFVERGVELLLPHGQLGAITSRTGLFISSFENWREEILIEQAPPSVIADLGFGVLDGAMVETAAYCLEKGGIALTGIIDARTVHPDAKGDYLESIAMNGGRDIMRLLVASFRSLPGCAFAYWLGASLVRAFAEHPQLEKEGRCARRGAYTTDDFRFNRLSTEVLPSNVGAERPQWSASPSYANLAKGGAFARYYADIHLVLRWSHDGREAKSFCLSIDRVKAGAKTGRRVSTATRNMGDPA